SGRRVVLVGPKYHLPYGDGLHLTNEGYRHLGEDFAKVYRRVVLERQPWEPLRPSLIVRDGATIEVSFFVPAPPLVFDTSLVSDPGHYGFSYVEDGPSVPTIVDISLVAPDKVRIRLDAAPTGSNRRLRYAYSGVLGVGAGPRTGPRGNLRDS